MKCDFTSDELYLIQLAVRKYIRTDVSQIIVYEDLKTRMDNSFKIIDKVTAYLSHSDDFDVLN